VAGALERGVSAAALDARERLPLLELLRIVASLAVVHHHMRTGFVLGIGFGLPLFLLILFGLSSSGSTREPLLGFAQRKARFLLVPWLRWSAIYVALLLLGNVAQGRAPLARLESEMLWSGGHLSLWFLPFAAVAVVAARALQRCAARLPIHAAMLAAALSAALWTEVVAYVTSFDLPRLPARFWLRSSPGILWGLALGLSLKLGTRSRCAWLGAVTAVATLAFLLSPSGHDDDSIPRRYAVAVPLVCVGFVWKPRLPAFVPALAGVCFGVYLVHSLVGSVLWHLFEVSSWNGAVHTLAAWSLSALLVAGLRRVVPWHELSSRQPAPRALPSATPVSAHELASADRKAA